MLEEKPPFLYNLPVDDTFRIFVEQLREGKTTSLKESINTSFLGISDANLKYSNPVELMGTAYLAEDHLMIRLSMTTKAMMTCTICNEWTEVPVTVPSFYLSVPIEEIKGGIYNLEKEVREAILLETPRFAECHGGECPSRNAFKQYFKNRDEDGDAISPFESLDPKKFN